MLFFETLHGTFLVADSDEICINIISRMILYEWCSRAIQYKFRKLSNNQIKQIYLQIDTTKSNRVFIIHVWSQWRIDFRLYLKLLFNSILHADRYFILDSWKYISVPFKNKKCCKAYIICLIVVNENRDRKSDAKITRLRCDREFRNRTEWIWNSIEIMTECYHVTRMKVIHLAYDRSL